MMILRSFCVTTATGLLTGLPAFAHQPVMDMAPRWSGGYGFQIRQENYGSNKLLNGNSEVANTMNEKNRVNTTWLEGVYTFDRSMRMTFKLPYVSQERTINNGGVGEKQKANGLGDLILGMPLKRYTNLADSTGNISFTPSLRLPTGSTSGLFPISDGSLDFGLSFSYSKSTEKTYQLYDLFYWFNNEGYRNQKEANELGFDANIGWHPYHDNATNTGMFVMWDVSARYQEKGQGLSGRVNGGSRVHSGPVLVLYKNNVMFRSEYKFPVYENVEGTNISRGNEFQIGMGVTF